MKVYMIRNIETGEWFCSYKKKPNRKWTQKQDKASLWQHKSGPIQTMRSNKLDASIAKIIEFNIVEIE